MNIKRFFAADMRQAIRKVRDELGPDAVILSNRKAGGGIEIVAAVDYDEAEVRRALAEREAAQAGGREAGSPRGQAESPAGQPQEARQAHGATTSAEATARPAFRPEELWAEDPALAQVRREIHELRGLLEHQLAHLAWGEMSRRHPLQVGLLRRLSALGLTPDVSRQLATAAAGEQDLEQAWRRALALLTDSLSVTDDDILDQGGVVALVGPTGVGKTTTVAKLAARFALRHGQRNVALVTTDGYRIGAHEQLFTYGRILGVPVQVAADHRELDTALKSLLDKRLVLIDTAGMSQRDVRLSEQFATLRDLGIPVRTYLVLAANTQAAVMEEAVKAFAGVPLAACILTKLDETASLGGALSVVARHRLPLAYLGDGQRVPEDIHPARAQALVNRAVSLMDKAEQDYDDDILAERFGGLALHARA